MRGGSSALNVRLRLSVSLLHPFRSLFLCHVDRAPPAATSWPFPLLASLRLRCPFLFLTDLLRLLLVDRFLLLFLPVLRVLDRIRMEICPF